MSQSGHCKLALWLEHHYPETKLPILPGTQRTFDMGHMVEKMFFEQVEIRGRTGPELIGDWWNQIELIEDHVTGWRLYPSQWPVTQRQLEVSIGELKGHIDGAIDADVEMMRGGDAQEGKLVERWVLDVKSAAGFQWDRATFTEDLMEDVFLREYVRAQNLYVLAYREQEKIEAAGSCLVFFNKEQSKVSARFLRFDEVIAADALNRLLAGTSTEEPMPDWEWKKDTELPLRCSYCDFKQGCADTRGMILEGPEISKRGKPIWTTR